MGRLCAGIISSFGDAKVYLFARDMDKAEMAIEQAVMSVRSETIRKNLIPCTYDHDFGRTVSQSDWVLETLVENYNLKEKMTRNIAAAIKPGTFVSTISSGFSITKLSKIFTKDLRKYYFGTHFFNPPYKMTLCEIIYHPESNLQLVKNFGNYLEKSLLRQVVYIKDSPAFVANRIAFQLMNEAAQFAEKYQEKGGIALIDLVMGKFTGRSLALMETLDFVGLDIYKAIVDNIYSNTTDSAHKTFKLPPYMNSLIKNHSLGLKSGAGLYKTVKASDGSKSRFVYNIKTKKYEPQPVINLPFITKVQENIYYGRYQEAMDIIKNSREWGSQLTRYFIARYISYSLSLVGDIVDSSINIDKIMAYGFNWIPPTALVDLLGGKTEAIKFIKNAKLPVPSMLFNAEPNEVFYKLNETLNARSFLRN